MSDAQAVVTVDDFARERLALVVYTSLPGMRVARKLGTRINARGRLPMIISDNGIELTSRTILQWQDDTRFEWHDIALGTPMQKGFVESLSMRFRDECLNEYLSRDLAAARRIIEESQEDYNEHRPHTSLNGLTVNEFANRLLIGQMENKIQL